MSDSESSSERKKQKKSRTNPYKFIGYENRLLFAMIVANMNANEFYFWIASPDEASKTRRARFIAEISTNKNLFLDQHTRVKKMSARVARNEIKRITTVRQREKDLMKEGKDWAPERAFFEYYQMEIRHETDANGVATLDTMREYVDEILHKEGVLQHVEEEKRSATGSVDRDFIMASMTTGRYSVGSLSDHVSASDDSFDGGHVGNEEATSSFAAPTSSRKKKRRRTSPREWQPTPMESIAIDMMQCTKRYMEAQEEQRKKE